MDIQQKAKGRGNNGSKTGKLTQLRLMTIAHGKSTHKVGKIISYQHDHTHKQNKNRMQKFDPAVFGNRVQKPPHHAHGNKRKNN